MRLDFDLSGRTWWYTDDEENSTSLPPLGKTSTVSTPPAFPPPTAFPALLYDFAPQRSAGQLPLAQPLTPQVGQWYAASCRWGVWRAAPHQFE